MEKFDAAIIGAGPAGAAAAISLAGKGYRVALIDKEKFPRDKLCGDFINPVNWPILRELGVESDVLSSEHGKVTAFRITTCSGEHAEAPLPAQNRGPEFGLGLSRTRLDMALLRKAAHKGAIVLQGCRIKNLKRDSRGWALLLDHAPGDGEILAPVLIGADGRNSWVAHRLGLASAAETQGRSVGFQIHLDAPHAVRANIDIHLFPGGYAGLVGVGGNSFNLCLAVDKQRLPRERQVEFLLKSLLPQNPYLRELLLNSRRVGDARATYPVYFKPRRCVADGLVFIGDAARVNEPMSGEGIYFAMKSALLAAETIDAAFAARDFSANRLRSYERRCRRQFKLRRGLNTLLRHLAYRPALLAPLVRFSAKHGRLLDALVHAICAPNPTKFRSHHEAHEGHEGSEIHY
jgi:geranylgeranyl reductase family protein